MILNVLLSLRFELVPQRWRHGGVEGFLHFHSKREFLQQSAVIARTGSYRQA